MKEGTPLGLHQGLDLVRKAVLKATPCAIEAETKFGKGVAERQTRHRLFGLGNIRGGGELRPLFDGMGRVRVKASAFNMHEVATGAERTDPD